MGKILEHLLNQIHQPANLEILKDLQKYCKIEGNLFQDSQLVDWLPRIIHTAELVTNLLESNAEQWLSGDWIEDNQILQKSDDFLKLLEAEQFPTIDSYKELAQMVCNKIQGSDSSSVSKSVCRHLANSCEMLLNKSASSSYPDIIRNDDYSFLTKAPEKNDSVPGMKGDRPTNIPDGVEAKAKRGSSIQLDTHGPKTGLFLQTCWDWDARKTRIVVNGVYIAYFNSSEFLRGRTTSEQTTIKWNPDYKTLRKRGNYGFIGIDGLLYQEVIQPDLFDLPD